MPVAGEFEKLIRLSSGMEIALLPFAKKTRVHIWLCVKTGSWDGYLPADKPNPELPTISYLKENGKIETLVYRPAIDHATEHVFFKGTEDSKFRTPLQVCRYYGPKNRNDEGAYGADTSELAIRYYTEIQPEELEPSLRFLSALTLRSLLKRDDRTTQQKLLREREKELRVVREEKGYNNDEEVLDEVVEKNRMRMFPGHPLGYSKEGEESDFLTLTLAEMRTRYQTRYHPSNMLLIVVGGGVTRPAIKKLVGKYFRAPRRKLLKIPVPQPAIPNNLPWKERIEFSALPRKKVYLAFGFPFKLSPCQDTNLAEWTRKHWRLMILKMLCGGRWASLPYLELREKRGIGYRHYADLEEYPGVGILTYSTHLYPEYVPEAIRLMLRIFKKLAVKPLPEIDFEHAKLALIDELHSIAETPGDLAEFIYFWVRHTGRVPMLEEAKKEIQAITSDGVSAVAQEVIIPERLFATFVGNLPSEKAQRAIRRMFQNWKLTK